LAGDDFAGGRNGVALTQPRSLASLPAKGVVNGDEGE
jgi:hypothetical protein